MPKWIFQKISGDQQGERIPREFRIHRTFGFFKKILEAWLQLLKSNLKFVVIFYFYYILVCNCHHNLLPKSAILVIIMKYLISVIVFVTFSGFVRSQNVRVEGKTALLKKWTLKVSESASCLFLVV